MLKELFDLLTRLVTAVEKIAANGGGGFVAEKTEKPKKADKKPEDPKSETAKEPEKKKADPFADDDPVVTKEQVRKALTDYANATDNETALKHLAKNTSNEAGKMGDIKAEDYARVYKAISALLADTKK